jgi:hypothetical protein
MRDVVEIGAAALGMGSVTAVKPVVGRCTLNQVDP